jgi:hypothetical protein
MSYPAWRRIHRTSSFVVAFVALVHIAVTFMMYDEWSPDAVWFLGTGVGLLCMAVMNIAHVGVEPCALPTAPVVRWLNWVLVALGVAAIVAVPEPQAMVIVLGLVGQAVAGVVTLKGVPSSPKGITLAGGT